MKMKIVFFGTPDFSVPFLQALMSEPTFDIAAAVSQPDKPSGRGKTVEPTPIKVVANSVGIQVLQPATLRSTEAIEALSALEADIFVVVAYGKIIPQTVLDIPKLGCLNVHPSLLPKYRGPSPMQTAIASGDAATGVTIMLLDAGMDTGPILSFVNIALDADETLASLEKKVQEQGAPFLVETIKRYAGGEITPLPQDESRATVTKLLEREDGRVNWTETMAAIERKSRAYQPWPGLWTVWQRAEPLRLKILRVVPSDFKADLPSGTVTTKNGRLFVDCSDGTLEILELQPEGKPAMPTAAFLAGYSDVSGAVFA
jgi:methionyl-tRNA formyltransferase